MTESEQWQRSYKNPCVPKKYERNMNEVFESWELILFKRIEEVDHVLHQMSREASASGVPKDYKIEFMKEKLIDIIDQVAERRN
ncbi:hypothetical protein D3C76_191190 [compost metagenome]